MLGKIENRNLLLHTINDKLM